MADKSYKSYRQQLNILRSRGMVIGKGPQGSRVMRILERENYYNVINGYKELFLASKATATADEKLIKQALHLTKFMLCITLIGSFGTYI